MKVSALAIPTVTLRVNSGDMNVDSWCISLSTAVAPAMVTLCSWSMRFGAATFRSLGPRSWSLTRRGIRAPRGRTTNPVASSAFHDRHRDLHGAQRPAHELAGIATVSPDQPDASTRGTQPLQQGSRAVAVLHRRGGHQDT